MINTASVCSLKYSEICCVLTRHKRQIVVMARQSDLSFQLLPFVCCWWREWKWFDFIQTGNEKKKKEKYICIGEILMCYWLDRNESMIIANDFLLDIVTWEENLNQCIYLFPHLILRFFFFVFIKKAIIRVTACFTYIYIKKEEKREKEIANWMASARAIHFSTSSFSFSFFW